MDNQKLNLGRVVAVWVIAAVGIILSIYLFANIAPDAVDDPTEAQLEGQAGAVSVVIGFTTLLVYIVLGLIVVFMGISIVTNFKKQMKSLIIAGVLLILVLIFYATGNSDIPQVVLDKGATESDALIASSGIGLASLLSTVAVLLALFMGVITKYVIKN